MEDARTTGWLGPHGIRCRQPLAPHGRTRAWRRTTTPIRVAGAAARA